MLFKIRKNKKGFTLIELIVVVAILAILAAFAIPNIIGLQDTAKTAVEKSNAATIASAINIFNASTTGTKITSKPADLAALNTALGANFSVTITGSAAEISAAYARVTVSSTGLATFN
jgi:prepilin-type N-terminal cleavage/methylation domain-containing protein